MSWFLAWITVILARGHSFFDLIFPLRYVQKLRKKGKKNEMLSTVTFIHHIRFEENLVIKNKNQFFFSKLQINISRIATYDIRFQRCHIKKWSLKKTISEKKKLIKCPNWARALNYKLGEGKMGCRKNTIERSQGKRDSYGRRRHFKRTSNSRWEEFK